MDFLPAGKKMSLPLILGLWLTWTALYASVAYGTWHGGKPAAAVWDSIVSNLLLAGTALMLVMILRHYLPGKKNYLNLLALCAASTALWYAMVMGVWKLIPGIQEAERSTWQSSLPIRFALSFLVLICVALVTMLLETQKQEAQEAARKASAEKLARDAELFHLQQQLQPHFLFNSLNSINALVSSDPELARDMIRKLSSFLRGTLKKDGNTMTSLEEELQQIELYLSIEKIRFSHRLTAGIEADPKAVQMKIPALLLQPVMENAIKFGLYGVTGDVDIRLKAWTDNEYLKIQVSNPFSSEQLSQKKGAGFGLQSVQRRLYLLFGRNDLLHTRQEGPIFITEIMIPPYDKGTVDRR